MWTQMWCPCAERSEKCLAHVWVNTNKDFTIICVNFRTETEI